jgi:transmembrane sensor
MDKSTFINYINNQCTPEELESVIQWLLYSAHTQEGQDLLHEIFEDVISKKGTIDFDEDRLLDRIHHTLNINQTRELLSNESIGIQKKRSFRPIFRFFSRAAAILFLPLLLYTFYVHFSTIDSSNDLIAKGRQLYNKIIAPQGSVVSLDLPDGSKVWLNNGSKLRFPAKFNGNKRIVELEGEGYFEVMPNPRKPFIVDTKKIRVIALGTKFNVMAYMDDPDVETSLKEGKVLIQRIDKAGKGHTLLEMKPSEYITFNSGNEKLTLQRKDPEEYSSWINGKLVFRNVPLDQVVRKLSRWYNVEFDIQDSDLEQYSYTATLIDETLPQVLELMKIATPIDYTIKKRLKLEDGTYTKKKVTIWKKRNLK